ncbi:MAG TPA: hypothetical protein VKZ53_11425 [Candidatus Angelobacter sp.]|nr:hypothetical protein [Candidatus Angelobacter sp.]
MTMFRERVTRSNQLGKHDPAARCFYLRGFTALFHGVCVVLLLSAAMLAQTTTQSASLGGFGSLSYSLTKGAVSPCSHTAASVGAAETSLGQGETSLTPGGVGDFFVGGQFQVFTSSGFVYHEPSGVTHSLSGSASFISSTSGASCPPNGSSGTITLAGQGYNIAFAPAAGPGTASMSVILHPQYYILSILYDPPGNQSNNGYTSSTSSAATTTISNTFASGTSTNISASLPFGAVTGSVTFGTTKSSGTSTSFQVTTGSGNGAQLKSNRNPIDHTQDVVFLWLNPEIVITPTGPSSATYTIGTVTDSNGQQELPNIVNVSVAGLQNPSLIGVDTLGPQALTPTETLPGLASICAHPLPAAQCTQANACGCVPSDFATILQQDPLVGSSQTTAPSQVDSNRYKFIGTQKLEGPPTPGAPSQTDFSFTETDSNTTTMTETSQNSYSVGYSIGSGVDILGFGLKINNTNTFTWTNSLSIGNSSTNAHQASILLLTSDVGCVENIDIYEDTVYHTFALALPATPPSNCN